MSSFINGSYTQNLFYFKEYIDKEKLISKIVSNIESKIKLIEEYKNKYYISNNISENIIMTKFEFLEIMNEFEETITQSLQGMKSLIVEIRNLKDKKELENKISKNKNKNININYRNNDTSNYLNNLCYDYSKEKNYSQYLEEYINNEIKNNNKDNKDKKENKELNKNKSFCETKEMSLFANMYGPNNNLNINNKFNGGKNKLYYKKNTIYSAKNIPAISIKKNRNNINNFKNDISELESKNSNDDISQIDNNRNNNNMIRYNKLKKTISNDSITEKDLLAYDISLVNDLEKEIQNQNQSSSFIINNNNDLKSINIEPKNTQRKILRLQLKNKSYKNINDKQNKNNSFSQKYEIELQNTNQEKNEKIEVEIKCPIRQGIRQNCRKNSAKIGNSQKIINRFNYNKNKKDIIEKINSNEKLKNYFAKKYGGNKFETFLNKFWKNKLNIKDIASELDIISIVIKKDENIEKIKNKEKKIFEENNNKNYRKISHKQNNSDYEFKFISKTPMQNIISNENKNYKTITPDKHTKRKY